MRRWTIIISYKLLLNAFVYCFICTTTTFIKFSAAEESQNFKMDTLLTPSENVKGFNCECGKINRKVEDERLAKVKIFGGRLPWLAELTTSSSTEGIMDDDDNGEDFELCFGTLISLQTVLFPASCIHRNFYSSNSARMKPRVRILGILGNRTAALHEISHIRVHPAYRKNFDNDLALVKLRKRVDVMNANGVVPVCLPPTTKKYYPIYPPTGTPQIKFVEEFGMKIGADMENEIEIDHHHQPTKMIKPTTTKAPKPNFVLENSVLRTWFYRKAAGYDYIQHFGRFPIQAVVNSSDCQSLYPEMLTSKLECIQQKEIKEVVKQNEYFFKKLELGMPLLMSNTTLVKGKPQTSTTKYYLKAIRAPGRNGVALLESRNDTISLLKIEDYVSWMRETSGAENFCRL